MSNEGKERRRGKEKEKKGHINLSICHNKTRDVVIFWVT